MSIRAMNWAMEQATGDPRAQCLLYVIADAASPDGISWPSVKHMAAKSQQSKATVQRRLKDLEEMGALARFPRWEDEDGRVNQEGRGRRTSDEIRLLLDRKIEFRTADDDDEPNTTPPSQPATGGSQPATPPSPSSDGPPSHCSDPYMNLESEPKKDSPLPPKGGVTAEIPGEEETRKSQTFAAFEAAGGEPILHQARTRQIWAALTAPEEILATAAWRGYQAHRRAQRKPPNAVNAHKFLQERDAWEGFAKVDAKAQTIAARTEVTIRTPEGSAWIGLHVIVGIFPYGFNRDPGGKFLVPSPLPLAVMAFAGLTDERGRTDKSGWYFAAVGSHEYGAWFGFVSEASGRHPRVEDHNSAHGLWVPWQWPPRKDGSLSTAGPDPVPDGIEEFR